MKLPCSKSKKFLKVQNGIEGFSNQRFAHAPISTNPSSDLSSLENLTLTFFIISRFYVKIKEEF